jgi:twitching motility two-component system response regulator PilH
MINRNVRKILVVEDSPTQALALKFLLEAEGLRVMTADNGRLGVEMAYVHSPDAIVLDLEMPGMNGYEATALISGDYRTGHVPVIIFTAHDTIPIRVKTSILGATRFIRKGENAFPDLLKALCELDILDPSPSDEGQANEQA